jgi:SAM-dependent methyltransferase
MYLQDFHRRHAGVTSAWFGHLTAKTPRASYASSYHVLSDLVPHSVAPLTVLDLACGDGHLLNILHARQQPSLRLIGMDMSEAELRLARAILPDNTLLLNARAQEMALPEHSTDYVLSHMAMMLMDNVEGVMGEIQRVLKPRGQFAAIVGRALFQGEVSEIFRETFRPFAERDLPPLAMGDSRTGSEAGWTELLHPAFDHIQFEDIDIPMHAKAETLWSFLAVTYNIDRLPHRAAAQLRSRLLSSWAPLRRSDGTLQTAIGLRCVGAVKR